MSLGHLEHESWSLRNSVVCLCVAQGHMLLNLHTVVLQLTLKLAYNIYSSFTTFTKSRTRLVIYSSFTTSDTKTRFQNHFPTIP
jgi:hypothetical protein